MPATPTVNAQPTTRNAKYLAIAVLSLTSTPEVDPYSPLGETKGGAAGVLHEIPMSSKPLSSRPSKCRQPVSCRLMSFQRKPLWV
jgi:hypothetical protein